MSMLIEIELSLSPLMLLIKLSVLYAFTRCSSIYARSNYTARLLEMACPKHNMHLHLIGVFCSCN